MKIWWCEKHSHSLLCAREIRAAISLLTIIVMMTLRDGLVLLIKHTSEAYVRMIRKRNKFSLARHSYLSKCSQYLKTNTILSRKSTSSNKMLHPSYCFARTPQVTNFEDHMGKIRQNRTFFTFFETQNRITKVQ
jgi:hypothetical protein